MGKGEEGHQVEWGALWLTARISECQLQFWLRLSASHHMAYHSILTGLPASSLVSSIHLHCSCTWSELSRMHSLKLIRPPTGKSVTLELLLDKFHNLAPAF